MISKEMYLLLKEIPRNKEIPYSDLNKEKNPAIDGLLCEAFYDSNDLISKRGGVLENCVFSITEKGQAALEEYEQVKHNQEVVDKSLKVAKVAMWAAIGSAVAAVLSLIKMFL